MKLFCIAHAGGSCIAFNPWKELLSEKIELLPLEYPGHMLRANEPFCQSVEESTLDLTEVLESSLGNGEDYFLYGHSMGGMIAYLLCMSLLEKNFKLPKCLFISGSKDPYTLSEELSGGLTREEGYEKFVVAPNQGNDFEENGVKLNNYFMNLIEHDLLLVEKFKPREIKNYLNIPAVILYGSKDKSATFKVVKNWARLFEGSIYFKKVNGGHFFPFENSHDTVGVVNDFVEKFS